MPYFTTNLKTALNRAQLFMSIGELQRAVVLHNSISDKFAVVDRLMYAANHVRYASLGYVIVVDLQPQHLVTLTGSIQLDLLEEDVYAISQENL